MLTYRSGTWNLAHLTALCFDGTGGSGGGSTGGSGTGTGGTGAGATGTGTAQTSGSGTGDAGATGNAGTTAEPVTLSRADYDALNARLGAAEKATKDAEKARVDADKKAAEEQGNFKKLYEDSQTQLAKLQPDAERAPKYAQIILKQVTKLMESVPEYVASLLKDRDPVEQLEWLNENADKLKGQGGGANAGSGGGNSGGGAGARGGGTNPGAAGSLTQEERVAQERRALLGSGDYGSLG